MARGFRIASAVVGILLLLVVLAVWFLISNLDGIVKGIVENVGSETLGTQVTLDSASISLREATATLRGLRIANPPGFETDDAFALGRIKARLVAPERGGTEIVLEQVIADQAHLNFEQRGSRSNLQVLLDNMKKTGTQDPAESDQEAADLRLVIEEFQLNNAGMTVTADGLTEPLELPLADIRLRDIGRAGSGATLAEATRQIMEPVLDRAAEAAGRQAQKALEEELRKRAGKEAERALEELRNRVGGQ